MALVQIGVKIKMLCGRFSFQDVWKTKFLKLLLCLGLSHTAVTSWFSNYIKGCVVPSSFILLCSALLRGKPDPLE